ncbi:MAG TPA: DMT family transporter [Polyangiaceae bacterium]
MSWLLLAALSAVFLGFYDVAKKAALDHNAVLPVLACCSLSGLLLFLPVVAQSWLQPAWAQRHDLYVDAMHPLGHLLVLAKAGIVTLSWLFTFFAIKHLPISMASPIRASAPLFTVLGAITLFGELPSHSQLAGMLVILFSYLLFSVIGRKEGIRFEDNRWVWMLFAGTLVGAISGLYDKHLMQHVHLAPMSVQFWFTFYNSVIQCVVAVLFWYPERKQTTAFRFRGSILLVGLLLLLADNVYFRALAVDGALVSVVSTIRRSNVVISFAVGSLVFREQQRLQKAFALAGVLLGVVLLMR